MAKALDVPLGADDPVVQLGHAIAGRGPCLVILDNFEQVARHADETLGRWLDRAPEAQFVVTTREVLGLPGETALALAPLRPAESVDLFVTRARQAKRDFVLTDADRPHVEALVKLLDRLPLAIELAAARVRVMPPKTLLQRMSERFKLLASAGGRHTRQATLRGALDWSWELVVGGRAASAGAALGVRGRVHARGRRGGAVSPESVGHRRRAGAGRQVARAPGLGRAVRPAGERAGVRFERLAELGGSTAAEERHGAWYAGAASVGASGAPLAADLDNLVGAGRRAVRRADADVAVPTVRAAVHVLRRQGPLSLGVELASSVLAMDTLSPPQRAAVGSDLGWAHSELGRTDEAIAAFEVAAATHRACGDRRGEDQVRTSAGWALLNARRYDEAAAAAEAVTRSARDREDREVLARALGFAATVARRARPREAPALFEQALAATRAVGDPLSEASTLSNLGSAERAAGRIDRAEACYVAAAAVQREAGDNGNLATTLGNLGTVYSIQGRWEEARVAYDEALAIARRLGRDPLEMWLSSALAIHCGAVGQVAEALELHTRAVDLCARVGLREHEAVERTHRASLLLDLGRLTDVRSELDAAAGSVGETAARAAYLRGRLLHLQGDADGARPLLERALATARERDDPRGESACLVALTLVHVDAMRLDEALDLALRAVERGAAYSDTSGTSLGALVRVHLARGEHADAGEAIRRARALTVAGRVRAWVVAVSALVAASVGEREVAEAELAEDRRSGLVRAR